MSGARKGKRKKKVIAKLIRQSLEELLQTRGRTDWARVDALTDAEIDTAIASDPDAAPTLDENFWKDAELVLPTGERKAPPVSLRLDQEILDYFRRSGRGYQTRINTVLRAYVRSRPQRDTPYRNSTRTARLSK